MLKSGVVIGAAAAASAPALGQTTKATERWGVHELVFNGPDSGNPFDDVTLAAVFERAGQQIRVPGFYDGKGVYRVRFSPPEIGRWTWRSTSNVRAIDGQSGSFDCVAPAKGNHGPVRVSADGYHFTYADGTPYRQIGTTCYSWALQSDAKCTETLKTLRAAPFNKMRMLITPNVPSVATNPFARTGDGPKDWDPTRFDPDYFRRYEDRILRLGALGIEADIILFHPYDEVRGYNDMARADDERYVRYVAARFGAYRHVWWAMANEYDAIKTKTMADWDHLFEILVAADPHDRLRSIHQINTYYDHRKPWITHASVQNGAAVLDDLRAELHRAMTLKPVVFDEVVYEGNSTKRWGWLSGEEMVERFWWGLLGGTYVGHSETFDPNRDADFSWLGQGGVLKGTSAPRLAFLKQIMEDGPVPGIDPIQPWWNYHIAGKPFDYYLKYFGTQTPAEWPVILPGRKGDPHGAYRADIIDTWNMTITPVEGVFRMEQRDDYNVHDPARPNIALPDRPYIALRLRKA
ncbi:DUF5060 domain-containing protein [Hephaestia sp. GCM10023244]|uniref:DUF5060 domain-containing protein n=1 Tax=unclassified Hephaestia TaxID=2631281 RepID=UPI002077473D|nr:DUF5060 domain-containing protein [Hephaestia sp. MAHUQ-44]MCM8732163.1 DUF5060 domain-containing protein [Hephaestia sp. MAHUQ-44]